MTARVLVVDDVPVNVKLLEAKLLVEYYEVVTAHDGVSALQVAHDQRPDIILLDVMMPGMDGYEVCRRVKADATTAHIPVVMVTALNEVSDRVRGLEAGADDFLTKPVNDVALFARIRSLVRLKRTSDEWRAREATAVELGVTGATDNAVNEKAPGSILLATDGMWDKEAVTKTLIAQGHKIDHADNDASAISMASQGDYDIVIVADGDRSSDALRLCSQFRSLPETRHGPILLLVSEGTEDRLAKALELGINDYLVRPVEQDELIARSWTQIRRKRYEERLRENFAVSVNAAVTDPLTGLYNRRYLESHFERISDRLKEEGKTISLLMLDIDHFKKVNDTYGHDSGDQVLQAVAKRIVSNLRGFDTAVRFGGEEFVILLPDAPLSAAVSTAERLCKSMSSAPIPMSNGGEAISITASLGAATTMAGDESLEELVRRADAALY
ncbi:MAG: PleD family two-component system response regulator, partial [Proteobacteria bacterium]|nr:PleD family two-component system response regulator [Pseudomonadota bacterium]